MINNDGKPIYSHLKKQQQQKQQKTLQCIHAFIAAWAKSHLDFETRGKKMGV